MFITLFIRMLGVPKMANDKKRVAVKRPGKGMLMWRTIKLERVERELKTGKHWKGMYQMEVPMKMQMTLQGSMNQEVRRRACQPGTWYWSDRFWRWCSFHWQQHLCVMLDMGSGPKGRSKGPEWSTQIFMVPKIIPRLWEDKRMDRWKLSVEFLWLGTSVTI